MFLNAKNIFFHFLFKKYTNLFFVSSWDEHEGVVFCLETVSSVESWGIEPDSLFIKWRWKKYQLKWKKMSNIYNIINKIVINNNNNNNNNSSSSSSSIYFTQCSTCLRIHIYKMGCRSFWTYKAADIYLADEMHVLLHIPIT